MAAREDPVVAEHVVPPWRHQGPEAVQADVDGHPRERDASTRWRLQVDAHAAILQRREDSPRRDGVLTLPSVQTSDTLVRQLRALIDSAQAIDTPTYERAEINTICDELFVAVERLLDDADRVLKHLQHHYESSAPASDRIEAAPAFGFGEHADRRLEQDHADADASISDIAFIARMELAQRTQQFRCLTLKSDRWDQLAVCARVRRRVIKFATALDRAVCERAGIEFEERRYLSVLRCSLDVRQEYVDFRDRLKLDRPPSSEELRTRLRLVGTSLAILIGRPCYEDLRTSDRRMLRELQSRLLGWLRESPFDSRATIRAGIRLWQDTAAFAGLLMQVNLRTELIEHDHAVLLEIRRQICSARPTAPLEARTIDQLRRLIGRDPELDACIRRARGSTYSEIEAPVTCVLTRLGTQVAPQPGVDLCLSPRPLPASSSSA